MSDMLGPYELNSIICGDARELAKAIPDESVDLIFTDPVYDRIDDYRWLAETAARVLKPDSACLVWYAAELLPNTLWALCAHLNYRLVFTSIFPSYPRWMDMLGLKSKKLLWMEKGRVRPIERIYDVQYETDNSFKFMRDVKTGGGQSPNGNTSWAKGTDFSIRLLSAFSQTGTVVLDPFTGGGTVPAVCKMLSRHYLAFEIDPETHAKAVKRVAETQPPLFVLQPTQTSFLPDDAA